MTAENITQAFDTLSPADVYSVIAYYLGHRDEVRAYLKARQSEADDLQARIESNRTPISCDELQQRRKTAKATDAPTDK